MVEKVERAIQTFAQIFLERVPPELFFNFSERTCSIQEHYLESKLIHINLKNGIRITQRH